MDVTSAPVYDVQMPSVAAPQQIASDAPEAAAPLRVRKHEAVEPSSLQAAPLTQDVIEKALEQINKSLSSYNRELNVSVHEKTKTIMVKVVDTVEKKVIREIPPEKILDAYAKMLELTGILVDKKR